MSLTLRCLGSGDAFGSGGRLQTCLHLTDGATEVLLDCGASALTAMKRFGVRPATIDAVILSHLHGDHFGGVPFLLLDACFGSRRQKPLVLAGPPGLQARIEGTLELLFPRATTRVAGSVDVRYVELAAGKTTVVGPVSVVPYPAVHPSGSESFALRLEWADRTLGFSGDTAWTDALLEVARGADLYLTECYTYDKAVPYHLSYRLIRERLADLGAKRVMLTHMGEDMLANRGRVDLECAEDGLVVTI